MMKNMETMKNRKLRLRAACGLLAVLAAAVLTACGSSGTGGQNGTEAPSEALETSAPESAAEAESGAPGPRVRTWLPAFVHRSPSPSLKKTFRTATSSLSILQ